MEQLTDLKAILHSKRANIYYLEKCRVMQKDGRVLYLTGSKSLKKSLAPLISQVGGNKFIGDNTAPVVAIQEGRE
jgi:hypothetical protein